MWQVEQMFAVHGNAVNETARLCYETMTSSLPKPERRARLEEELGTLDQAKLPQLREAVQQLAEWRLQGKEAVLEGSGANQSAEPSGEQYGQHLTVQCVDIEARAAQWAAQPRQTVSCPQFGAAPTSSEVGCEVGCGLCSCLCCAGEWHPRHRWISR